MTKELERVSQALRDERVLRKQADQRAAQATEQAKIWRRRAEERAERIVELEDARRPLLRRRKHAEATPAPAGRSAAPAPAPLWRSHPGIRLASAISPGEGDEVLGMFDTVRFEGAPPLDADVVLLRPELAVRWDEADRAEFRQWADSPGRAPLLILGDGRFPFPIEASTLPPSALISFVPAPPSLDQPADLVRIEPSALIEPATIDAAASGAPLAVGDANPSVAHATTAARRWAYRHFHPRRKAHSLTERAGLETPDPYPLVSAVLVSNRPELVPDQIRSIGEQTYRHLEILVGLHGTGPTPEIREAIEGLADDFPLTMATFPSSVTLGECLNETINSGSGSVIAKIDDDDFYGPAYLEDAIHALDYSRADIVGKATQFTYLAERDETVIRRIGQEERLMSGTPTGATMVMDRRIWSQVKFPHRPRFVDSVLVRGARALGARVFANSRWEFCYVRQGEGHTWSASSDALLAGAELAFPGFDARGVVVDDDCSGLTPLASD